MSGFLPPRDVERPRLTRLLDASDASVILLLAPAGYGKTTLARQWFALGDKKCVWYRATQASSDVAALGAGIARAIDPLLPGTADRLLQVIRQTAAPARDVEDVASAFVAELGAFPEGGWLVLDDYHFVVGSAAAERLVEAMAEGTPMRILIASRRRPRWATARRAMYGEIEEATQADLAFTAEEAARLLPRVPPADLSNWVARTKGWPALLKLVSVSGNRELPDLELPPELHNYFAEELFHAASLALQDALIRLVMLPTLRPRLLRLALGGDYLPICKDAVALGFLTESTDGTFEIHPLLRSFAASKARQVPETTVLTQRLVHDLIAESSWDEAFDVATNAQQPDLLPAVFEAALDDLLVESRLSTLERWVASATSLGAAFPLLDLAEAEIARRLGDFDLGEVRAVQAARSLDSGSHFRSRAWAVAGECAHLAARPSDALKYHEQAERLALSMRDARRAVWGQHVIAVSFEVASVDKSLGRLKDLDDGSPAAVIQTAIGELNRSILEGGVEQAAASATRYRHLLPRVTDPLVTTSFFVRLSLALILSGQYLRAFKTAEEGVALAKSTRSKFAIIHFAPVLIGASIGLRRFRHASILLEDLTDRLRLSEDTYETANAAIYRARLLLAQGSPELAAAHLDQEMLMDAPAPALRLEGLALLSLARAVRGEAEEALASVEEALRSSRAAEGVVLAALARTVHAAVTEAEDVDEHLATAMKLVRATGNHDSFVQAYRAYPPMLREVIVRRLLPPHKLRQVLQNAVDLKLADEAGFHLEPSPMPHHSRLTRREREVYVYLSNGLSNKEIANALVISESTAKVHVRHILEKLGASNRAQAVRASQDAF